MPFRFTILVLVGLFFGFASVAQNSIPSYIPTNGLIVWYPFNGNANDESGNGNNGTSFGAALITDRFGNTSSAYHFDGTTYIKGSSSNFPTQDRTISIWYKVDDYKNHNTILGYGGGVCGTSFFAVLDSLSGFASDSHCGQHPISTYNSFSENSNWNNWIITTDSVKTVYYLNGTKIYEANVTYNGTDVSGKDFAFASTSSAQGIAPYSDQNISYLKGTLDDIGIWNRVLTAQEIQQVYESNSTSQTNNALHFDRSKNNRVSIGNSPLLNTNYLTVQAWVKIDYIPGDWCWPCIVTKRNCCGGATEQWTLQLTCGGVVQFWGVTDNVGFYVQDPNPLPVNTWINYTGTYDGETAVLYRDGVQVSIDTAASGNIIARNWPVVIGDRDGGSDWFPGTIDEVRIWNRGLSQQEVQSNLNCELKGNEPGLVAYYNFNQGIADSNNVSETTLHDLSPNHLDGTLQNFTLDGSTSNWITPSAFAAGTSCAEIAQTFYKDADGDGYGNPFIDSLATSQPVGYVLNSTDCNDNDASGHLKPLPVHITVAPYDSACTGDTVGLLSNQSMPLLGPTSGSPYGQSQLDVQPSAMLSTTWEAWVYPTTTSSLRQTIFGDDDGGYDRNVIIEGNDFGVFMGSGVWHPVDVSFNQWQHIAIVYTPNSIKFYKNGVEYSYGSSASGGNTSNYFSVGNNHSYLNEEFTGNIDEVRVWNIERTQLQIQVDMNVDVDPTTSGLVANWKMNKVVNGSIDDEINNTYPLTFNGNLSPDYPTAFNNTYKYTWIPTTGLDSTDTQNTSFIASNNTSYQLKATTSYQCSAISDPVSITVTSCNGLIISANDSTTFCQRDSVKLTSSFANNNLWSNGETTQSITVKQSGNYYVVNNDDTSNTIKVTVNPLPVKPFITVTGSTFLCTDDTAILSGSNAASWKWNTGDTAQSIATDTTGKFTLTISDSLGCTSPPSDTAVISAAPKAAIHGDSAVCIGSTLSLTATGGGTYQWSGPNSFAATTASIKIESVSLADSGIYSVTIKYPGCPAKTISVRVYIVAPPKAVITGLSSSYCFSDSVVKLNAIPSGGVFFGNNVFGDTLKLNSIGTNSVSYTSPSYYGCPADTTTQSVTIYNVPSVTINATDSVLCADTIMLTANTSAGKFLWSTGDTAKSIEVAGPSTYSVTAISANGCSTLSLPKTIYNDSILHITTNKGTAICNADSIQLAFNGNNVMWSNGKTTPVIIVAPTASTAYSVKGNSVNGCSYSDSILITVNPNQPPGAVTNSYPPNNSLNLTYPINFSWLPGQYNTAFDFYLWNASQPRPSSPYISDLYSIGTTIINSLSYGTKYNWQIVSKNGDCAFTDGAVQTFTLANLPDLTVQNINADSVVEGGQQIHVEWQVIDIGSGNTNSTRWVDKIYLSPLDSTLQSNDILIGNHLNFSALDTGQSYTDTANINIPLNAAGKYYVIIKADDNNQILESNETNNLSASDSVIVNIAPASDLQVISVAPQTNVFSGDTIFVNYTIQNFGTAPVPYFPDSVAI